MKDKPNKLDDIIRGKLSGLGSAYRPETWDWLSDRLDSMEEPAADPLDDIVRDKMSKLAVPYRSETWDWLNERMEEMDMDTGNPAGAEVQTMDEAIYDRMHRFEKPYDPTHWPLLLKKLEANAMVGRRILRYKAMELSLLVLFLITLFRLPFPAETREVTPGQHLQQPDRPQALQDQSGDPETMTNTAVAGNLEEKNASENLPAGEEPGRVINGPESIWETQGISPSGTYFAVNESADPLYNNSPEKVNALSKLPSGVRELPAPTKNELSGVSINPALKTGPEQSSLLALNPGNVLGVMTYLPASMIRPLCQSCVGRLDNPLLEAKQPTFFRIGMQGGPDYNRVITPPFVKRGETYQDDRYALGYSGGLTLGFEKDRWEIETGLIYSNKRYYPLPFLVLDGSVSEGGFFGDGTKQFDLDIFQVPLNFRYNFIRKDRWRVYALAGVSLQVTSQSNYYLAEAEGFQSESFRPQPSRPGTDNQGRNAPSIKSEFDNFTKGWLEGGRFLENSFLTGNVGVGIERFITDYWSIYAQPTYSHSWLYFNKGLGPYYDRIHTNSLIFGVKVRLK